MTVAGVCTVKDEADVIAGTISHMADEVDFLMVVDNGSTDGTREILAELEDTLPLTVIDDDEVGYYQSGRMSRLAEQAAVAGAAWIVPFDADELWVAPERISTILEDAHGVNVANARLYNHFPTAIDPDDPDPFRSIVWRQRDPGALPKVAVRWHAHTTIHQGNHDTDRQGQRADLLEVRHFPYRSAEQFIRKSRNGAAAYRATDLPPEVGAHWRAYGDILDRHGEEGLAEVFREHFWFLSPTDSGLVQDPAAYMRWRAS